MAISSKALDLENRSIGVDGKPTLAAAYESWTTLGAAVTATVNSACT
jgi:hypothetical protein